MSDFESSGGGKRIRRTHGFSMQFVLTCVSLLFGESFSSSIVWRENWGKGNKKGEGRIFPFVPPSSLLSLIGLWKHVLSKSSFSLSFPRFRRKRTQCLLLLFANSVYGKKKRFPKSDIQTRGHKNEDSSPRATFDLEYKGSLGKSIRC